MNEIPERWREHYDACKENLAAKQGVGQAGHTQEIKIRLIEELATAEALVRDLAQDMTEAKRRSDWDPMGCRKILIEALSKIPKEMLPK
jgi:hypothetical protein